VTSNHVEIIMWKTRNIFYSKVAIHILRKPKCKTIFLLDKLDKPQGCFLNRKVYEVVSALHFVAQQVW